MLPGFIEFFTHIDQALPAITETYGFFTYLLLFIIIIFETGVVITPFLPGDSLLFVAGMIAAEGSLEIQWLIITFTFAAIFGDFLNYWTGNYVGLRVVRQRFPSVIRKEHITRTYGFFARYGGKTIFFARFVPILRTFAPFLAGVVAMDYRRFAFYNVLSAAVWAVIMTSAGYLLGSIPLIKDNLSIFITVFIIITIFSIIFFIAGILKAVFRSDT